jgi:hypothetical protein
MTSLTITLWKYFRKRLKLQYRSKYIYIYIYIYILIYISVFFCSHHSVSFTTVIVFRTVHQFQYSYYLSKPQLEYTKAHFSCWIINFNFLLTQNKNSSCVFMWGTNYRCRCKPSTFRAGRGFQDNSAAG